MTARADILTIGHSNHSIDSFIALLRPAEITAVIDIRSVPFSRWLPHFSKPALDRHLVAAGIAYQYHGEQLGGRPRDKSLWRNGVVDYGRIAATRGFNNGLDSVQTEASRYRIALLCSERDPRECHRYQLVSRHLASRGMSIAHILVDGSIIGHQELVQRDAIRTATCPKRRMRSFNSD